MSITAAIRDMLAKGFTIDQALIAAEVMEASIGGPKSNAQRQAEWRARQKAKRNESNESNENNEDVTVVTVEPEANARLTCAEPEPNKTTYPTTSEANASSVEPQTADLPLTGELLLPIAKPKPPPNSTRGCRIPPGFPGDSEREWAKHNLGFSDDDFDECAAEFRDYWSGAPGQRGVKCDWPATFRNGARKYRPRRGPRQAYPAGNQRSDGSLLGAYQRGAARLRAQNDVSRQRAGVFDHRDGELDMRFGIPAE